MRPVAIWTGENHRSPIFMNRKLAPQMTASDPNFTCQGTSLPVHRCQGVPRSRAVLHRRRLPRHSHTITTSTDSLP